MERIEFTLSWSGDTFKHSWRGLRKKLLHYVGVAQIKFVPVENEEGYTELFEGGADHGFIRLSLAKKQPDPTKSPTQEAKLNFVPGFALKLLRDNKPSSNLLTMHNVAGQDS